MLFLSLRGGDWDVSRGQLSLLFFFPNVLKIISKHKSFFKYRVKGDPLGPWGEHQAPPFGIGVGNAKCHANC